MWGPNIDGELIKEQAVSAFQKGHWQKEKAVLLGKSLTNRGTETKLFPWVPRTILCEVFRIFNNHWCKEVKSDLKSGKNLQKVDRITRLQQGLLAVFCPAGTTSEEGALFVYGVFNKPVSVVECTLYIAAIFKQHSLRILHKYLPLYTEADRRNMLAQVRLAPNSQGVPE